MAITVNNPLTYFRSKNCPPSNKAMWVNRWNQFHRCYKEIPMREWCGWNHINPSTFNGWLHDPRYNSRLRDEEKKSRKVEKIAAVAEVKEAKKEENPKQTDTPRHSTVETSATIIPTPPVTETKGASRIITNEMRVRIETEFKEDQNALGKKPYIVFASDKFRLTISEAMPAKDINMCIGYVKSLVEKMR